MHTTQASPTQPRARPSPDPPRRRRLSWRARRDVIIGALQASTTDHVSLAAAGCAYYATLALFPAISMLISVYGLAFDVQAVEQQLQTVRDLLPPPVFALIDERVRQLVAQPSATLSIGLIVSLLITFWSAATGTKSVLSALNVAYDVTERRGILRFQLVALVMTLCGIMATVLAITVLVLLPPAISFVGLSRYGAVLINTAGMVMVIVLVGISIALLYRFGPSRRPPPDQRIFPGAALATVLWLIASEALSFYVSRIAGFGITYGPLGAVVAVMLWFYLAAYAVLLGAELNAQLEQHFNGQSPDVL